MEKLRFKRHGSFAIRDGWFEKAINVIAENNCSVFSKENGVRLLGIGANMVTSLRYWLIASNIIDSNNKLSEFGSLIFTYDRYLDSEFTWWLVHYNLVSNYKDVPVFNIVFNTFNTVSFTKESLISFFLQYMEEHDIDTTNSSQLEADVSVLIRTYSNSKVINPEENLNSPLGKLGLLTKKEGNKFLFNSPSYATLPYIIVYKALVDCLNDKQLVNGVNIEDLMNLNNSPYKLFNLDKNLFYLYLNEMKSHGLITLNKTAGLNMLYVQDNLSLRDVFEICFKEDL